jgi:hypothetical protein
MRFVNISILYVEDVQNNFCEFHNFVTYDAYK